MRRGRGKVQRRTCWNRRSLCPSGRRSSRRGGLVPSEEAGRPSPVAEQEEGLSSVASRRGFSSSRRRSGRRSSRPVGGGGSDPSRSGRRSSRPPVGGGGSDPSRRRGRSSRPVGGGGGTRRRSYAGCWTRSSLLGSLDLDDHWSITDRSRSYTGGTTTQELQERYYSAVSHPLQVVLVFWVLTVS